MVATRWDPEQYLRYSDHRLRPQIELLDRVPHASPDLIYDLGCGTGSGTRIIASRWPAAKVYGLDSSAEMIQKSSVEPSPITWVQSDISTWQPEAAPDLIYTNAALHWVGGHEMLFPRLVSLLAPGGVLAVQMPAMHDAPLRRLQNEVAAYGPWASVLRDAGFARAILTAGEYYDLLRPHLAALDLWETTYLHVLSGEDAVVEWAAGSSLRPFLDKLPEGLRAEYRAAYAAALRPHYPRRPDGATLLPFRRSFMVGRR
jgi:trans-aconitate 2-methyltransferase